MNSRVELDRRRFLKTLGSVATVLPCAGALMQSAVYAQAGASALRFLALYHPHGAASPLFRLQPGETETEFDIAYENCVLAPFDDAATYGESFKDRIIILDGVDFSAAIENGKQGHDAPPCMLTGSGSLDTGAGNSSLDYFLAVEQGLGESTTFSHLVLGVGEAGSEAKNSITFGAGGAVLPKVIDPTEVFQSVFAGVVVGDDPEAMARAEAERREGQSILDYLVKDIARLDARLPAPEKYKLEQHLASLRELEKRLGQFEGSCQVPAEPPEFPSVRSYNNGEPYFEEITNLMVDLLAQAVACDLTRFGSLWMADLSRGAIAGTGITEYSEGEDLHNGVAHSYRPPTINGDPGDPATWLHLSYQNRYSYSKCARLMQQLSQSGALADTVILMSTDMGDPNLHSSKNVPMLLAGGAGGKWQMGRHIAMLPDCPDNMMWCSGQERFISNNKVLVAVAQAFGVATDSFGTANDPAITTGVLPELT